MHTKTLDYLRGLAALSVVFYHYFIFFFTNQTFCAKLCCFPPLDFMDPFIETVKDFPFDLGKFAVGLFFFLSGFLSPSLIDRYSTRLAFLKNRFFRLWPVYIVGLLVNVLFVYGACVYNGVEFPYSSDHLLASFLSLRDLFGYSYITGIVWTFEIEVKFVFFCILVFPFIKRTKTFTLLTTQVTLFLVFFSLYLPHKEDPALSELAFSVLKALTINTKYFCLLLMGIFLSFFKNNKISKNMLIILLISASFLFAIEDYFTVSLKKFITGSVSYTFALLTFVLLSFREVKDKSKIFQGFIIDFLTYISKISYPLYLIHAIPGYIIMYILYDEGFYLHFGMLMGLLFSFYCASILHKFIEAPMHESGRSKNLFKKRLYFQSVE